MWLLSTDLAELKYFNGPKDVRGGYAILSHVWKKGEQSFQEVQDLLRQDGLPHIPHLASKIHNCCELAQAHGYQWLWIDTCCIDKTSSAELSEAINSMFAWYASAQVCYVFLHDVPKPVTDADADALARHGAAFRASEWFTRGWTLQELLAPDSVVFLSKTWTVLGTKASLARLLEEITGIDADVLTFRKKLTDVSIARRMSWASKRRTTRIEDEAYSLMGIFGVSMPTIYGEGRRAFQRLQGEIIKQSADQTIFAWGDRIPLAAFPWRPQRTPPFHGFDPGSYLFASSPADFAGSADIVPISMDVAAQTAYTLFYGGKLRTVQTYLRKRILLHPHPERIQVPEFASTSHGIRCRVLLVEHRDGGSPFSVAVLACEHVSPEKGTRTGIGLILQRSPSASPAKAAQYHTGLPAELLADDQRLPRPQRLLTLDPHAAPALGPLSSRLTVRWRKLFLAQASADAAARVPTIPLRFLFPAWQLVELEKRGFAAQPAPERARGALRTPVLYTRWHMRSVVFRNAATGEAFAVQLGRCEDALWATVSFTPAASQWDSDGKDGDGDGAYPLEVHQYTSPSECERHHISRWPDGSKTFGDADRSVRLTFSRRQQEPDDLYVVDVQLAGRVYKGVRRVGCYFPPGDASVDGERSEATFVESEARSLVDEV
ncbi:heterokaryon incompatibility protein-domain-containing protein [Trametes meyenii]|nr:heterokaryon incompatibility protein-domain-containing protein [Trametes meyenii]